MIVEKGEIAPGDDPLRRQVRSPEWFEASFRRIATKLMAEHQLAVSFDAARLRAAFNRWHAEFEANRDLAGTARRDFILYMAGVVAKQLVQECPLTVHGNRNPGTTEIDRIIAYWPEGYCIFRYCAEICAEILEEEHLKRSGFDEGEQSLGTWASLRENVGDYAGWSVPFLQRLMDERPDWDRIDAPPRRS